MLGAAGSARGQQTKQEQGPVGATTRTLQQSGSPGAMRSRSTTPAWSRKMRAEELIPGCDKTELDDDPDKSSEDMCRTGKG